MAAVSTIKRRSNVGHSFVVVEFIKYAIIFIDLFFAFLLRRALNYSKIQTIQYSTDLYQYLFELEKKN